MSKEKICLFFASDYHFEMISLPYINESLKKDKNIVVITENNLKETINKVLTNLNLGKEDKDKIINLDWENDNLSKFKQIKKANEEKKETVIFIKGKENYINTINKNIENWINFNDVEIIDCYDINEVNYNVSNIANQYNKVLSTSGVEKLL